MPGLQDFIYIRHPMTITNGPQLQDFRQHLDYGKEDASGAG